MERRGPSHAGPFGQACLNCFRSKCKCVARLNGPGCERCHRLAKTCQPSDVAHRRTIFKKKDPDARIAELERKIDGLVSRLDGLDGTDHLDSSQITPTKSVTKTRSSRREQNTEALDYHSTPSLAYVIEAGRDQQKPDTYLNDEADDSLLSSFRSRMLPYFGFLYLPPETSISTLRLQRPLLLRAILCVTSRSHRYSRSKELKQRLSEALLSENTDSLDLLLALLTYLSWGYPDTKVLHRLTMQAIGLACELDGYSHSVSIDAPEIRAVLWPSTTGTVTGDVPASRTQLLEKQRAVLGCFVLSSVFSTLLNHTIDAMRWTSQMAESLALLGASRECHTDAAFATQVRLQLIIHQSLRVLQQHHQKQSASPQYSAEQQLSTAANTSLEALQIELQALRASRSVDGSASAHLAHVWAADLSMNETRYLVSSMRPFMISHFSAMTTGAGPPRNDERGQHLWRCFDAAKACIEASLTLSNVEFGYMSLLQWTSLRHGVAVIYHLAIRIEDPHWDRAGVRAVTNISELLYRIADKIDISANAAEKSDQGSSEHPMVAMAKRIREFCLNLNDDDMERGNAANINAQNRPIFNGGARDLFHIPINSYIA